MLSCFLLLVSQQALAAEIFGSSGSVKIVVLVNPITISPASGGALSALGHNWSFSPIQDDGTGNDLRKDGKATSRHGIRLEWDGTTLALTYHWPYDFNPLNGVFWVPPRTTESILQ